MKPYTSNSPQYLDYIASILSREEIENDPKLCRLLEDETIKENMEIALAYHDAEYGDYQDKINFVEYFFCNGPELDTHTILHYRKKILNDNTYSQIAADYFYDIEKIDKIRASKYNKKSDDWDCFTKPCNYLGSFANGIGLMGDKENFFTITNVMSERSEFLSQLNIARKEAQDRGETFDEEKWKKEYAEKNKDKVAPQETREISSYIKKHLRHWLIPEVQKEITASQILKKKQLDDIVQQFDNAGLTHYLVSYGDPYAPETAVSTSLMIKANVKRGLGDCARLWEHARRLNVFAPEENQQSTMPAEAQVEPKAFDGTSTSSRATEKPREASASPSAQVSGDKWAIQQWALHWSQEADMKSYRDINQYLAEKGEMILKVYYSVIYSGEQYDSLVRVQQLGKQKWEASKKNTDTSTIN